MQRVFDNYDVGDGCKTLWGFSAYFDEYKLLFDTGSNGRVLLHNMAQLGVDIQQIQYIFISHSHWDHTGGIDSLIEINPDVTLFLPLSLSKHLIADLKTMVKEVVICGKKPTHLFENLHTTGLLGSDMPEQSLLIDGDKPEVITGCGHFGVDNIVAHAREYLQKDIVSLRGGFHLLNKDTKAIEEVITHLKQMGVQKVFPTHCSGDKAIKLLQESFS